MLDHVRAHREAVLAIAKAHGVRRLRLFGSVARGDDTESSDIDFLAEFEQGTSLLDHSKLMIALTELMGRRVEIASERGLKPRIRDRVLTEAIEF